MCRLDKFKAFGGWLDKFITRHDLRQRLSQPWEHARQAHTNKSLIDDYFRILSAAIEKCGIDSGEALSAYDIFNLEEVLYKIKHIF